MAVVGIGVLLFWGSRNLGDLIFAFRWGDILREHFTSTPLPTCTMVLESKSPPALTKPAIERQLSENQSDNEIDEVPIKT